jgi:hypothetical protein
MGDHGVGSDSAPPPRCRVRPTVVPARPSARSRRLADNGGVTGGDGLWPASAQAEGSWISLRDNGRGYPSRVRDLVPDGFDAYVRLFNSIRLGRRSDLRWEEVAAIYGRAFHPKVMLHDVFPLPEPGDLPVVRGWSSQPSPRQWSALGRVLRRHTTGDTFFIGSWTGSGLPQGAEQQRLLQLPNREYSLVQVPLDDWNRIDEWRPVNIVWPSDRAWFLNSDIDSPETYVAATAAAVEQLMHDPELETAPADLDDRLALY